MFFFNSLVVGLPYNLIFWQFWLFFVFKFVVVLLLVVEGGKTCLPTPPSWQEVPKNVFEYLLYANINKMLEHVEIDNLDIIPCSF